MLAFFYSHLHTRKIHYQHASEIERLLIAMYRRLTLEDSGTLSRNSDDDKFAPQLLTRQCISGSE